MKKIILILCSVLLLLVCLTGCSESYNAYEEKNYTENLMKQIDDEIGMPEITNFYEKKMAKEILEIRDDTDLICYAYIKSEKTSKFIYIGKCKGYGLPYSTQYTNPEVYERYGVTIKQADPNGLYSGDGLSSTWLYLIDEETGKSNITYIESDITVLEAKLPKRIVEEWSIPEDY